MKTIKETGVLSGNIASWVFPLWEVCNALPCHKTSKVQKSLTPSSSLLPFLNPIFFKGHFTIFPNVCSLMIAPSLF